MLLIHITFFKSESVSFENMLYSIFNKWDNIMKLFKLCQEQIKLTGAKGYHYVHQSGVRQSSPAFAVFGAQKEKSTTVVCLITSVLTHCLLQGI